MKLLINTQFNDFLLNYSDRQFLYHSQIWTNQYRVALSNYKDKIIVSMELKNNRNFDKGNLGTRSSN